MVSLNIANFLDLARKKSLMKLTTLLGAPEEMEDGLAKIVQRKFIKKGSL
jgi:hypothetical protein